MNTINTYVHTVEQLLEQQYENPITRHAHAWWLVETATGISKTQLITQKELVITDEQQKRLEFLVTKHITYQMPLAYLIGSVSFGSLSIAVESPIMIPRCETEEWCLDLIKELRPVADQPLTILDLCTGSGCIALALAHALPNAQIYALDIAPHAIELTKHNLQINNISNVTALQSDLFSVLNPDIRFDLIVANPPYVTAETWHQLDDSVKQWEDHQALVAHDKGIGILATIAQQAPRWLKHESPVAQHQIPQLVMEHGFDQGSSARNALEAAGFNANTKQDLANNDRVVRGRMKYVAVESSRRTRGDHR